MFSFAILEAASTAVLLVYGLAAWRKRGQIVHFRHWSSMPCCDS